MLHLVNISPTSSFLMNPLPSVSNSSKQRLMHSSSMFAVGLFRAQMSSAAGEDLAGSDSGVAQTDLYKYCFNMAVVDMPNV